MPDFLSFLSLVSAFAGGVVVALKVIAPKTKTRADDKVLEWVEAILPLLPKSAPPVPKSVRPAARDHR